MKTSEVRKRYLEFFKSKGHEIIPSSSLVPLNDPTTLFTGSGMQSLLPYLLGEKHPKGDKLTNSQKCFRAEDIEEVGDNRHTTFFEMLGNWSLGSYWKEEQLSWFFEFLTKELKIPKDRLWVTCFEGDASLGIPKDTESADIWRRLGIPEERIFFYGTKNWWSRTGAPENMPVGEPGGPDSEVFFEFADVKHDPLYGNECHPNCDCGRFMEIGNSVFMQYVKSEDNSFSELPQKNVDFGGGLERMTTAMEGDSDVFQVDVLKSIIDKIAEQSSSTYDAECQKSYRIVADHLRGAVLIMSDGMYPSNTDAGYFVRRLLRRAIRHMDLLGMERYTLHTLVSTAVASYKEAYPHIQEEKITQAVQEEEEKFRKTLERGMREFDKVSHADVSGKDAFKLFTSYGFPLELTEELVEEKGVSVDVKEFAEQMKKLFLL